MGGPLPWPPDRGQWDSGISDSNPGRTNPAPAPSILPVQSRAAEPTELQWSGVAPLDPNTAEGSSSRIATWSPGFFDLMADYGNTKDVEGGWLPGSTNPQANNRQAIPVFGAMSTGVRVFMRIRPDVEFLNPALKLDLHFLRITYYEIVSAWNIADAYAATSEQDVSVELLGGNPPHYSVAPGLDPAVQGMAGGLLCGPPGGGWRYWSPIFTFRMWKQYDHDPKISMSGVLF